jgi:hypothetical protein
VLWLYAIARAGLQLPPNTTGVLDADVRAIDHGGVRAVVSDIDVLPETDEQQIMAHAGLIDELARDCDGALIPVRFGVAAPSERELVRTVLRRGERKFLRVLDELAGRVEVNVKADADEEGLLNSVAGDIRKDSRSGRSSDRRTGRAGSSSFPAKLALGEAVATAMHERAAAESNEVVRNLAMLAERTVRLPVARPLVLNASFLVTKDRLQPLFDAISQQAQEHQGRLNIRFAGPLPAYSFSDMA